MQSNLDPQGNPILPAEKLALIHQAALAECDGKDGLVDGQITAPELVPLSPNRCVVLMIAIEQTV